MNKLYPIIFVVIMLSAAFAAQLAYLEPIATSQNHAKILHSAAKLKPYTFISLPTKAAYITPSATISAIGSPSFGGMGEDSIHLACNNNEDCGDLAHAHQYTTDMVTGENQITVKAKTSEKGMVTVYISSKGLWHKLTDFPARSTDSWNTEAIVTNQKFNKILIDMPGDDSETDVTIEPKPMAPSGTRSIVNWDTCDNNRGWSADFNAGSVKFNTTGTSDPCNWYVRSHIHDMQSTISSAVNIYIDTKPGSGHGCSSTVIVHTSTDGINWNKAGEFSATSLDMDGTPSYPQVWKTTTYTIKNYNTNFRYIKVNNDKCFNDWSYVTVSNSVSNQNPVAALSIPSTANVNTQVSFNAGSSYDPDGTINSYTYEFGDFGTTSIASSSTTHTYTKTGTYTVSLIVKDGEGAQDQVTKTITIQNNVNVAPDIDITAPAYNSYNNTGNVMITYTSIASDLAYFQVKADTGSWINKTKATTTHTFTSLTEGNHTLYAKAVDTGGLSATDTVAVWVDKTAPDAEFLYPVDDGYTNSSSVTASLNGSADVDTYHVSLNGTTWYSTTSKTYTFKNMSEANHTYYLYTKDKAGNTSPTVNVTAMNDLSLPGVTITSPDNGTTSAYSDATMYYNTTATDVNYSLMMLDTGTACPSPYNYSWTDGSGGKWCDDPNGSPTAFKGMGDGWHTLHIRNVDNAGNIGIEDNITIYVDASRPSLTIMGPQNGTLINANYVDIDFQSAHSDVTKIEFSKDGSTWNNTGITTFLLNSNMSFNFTSLNKGLQTVYLRAHDNAGAGEATNITYDINASGNFAPTVTIDYPIADTYYTSGVTELKLTAIDDATPNLLCRFRIDGGVWNSTTSLVANNSQYTENISISTDGTHYIEAMCRDGNLAWTEFPPKVTFYIDTTAPTMSIITANDTMENSIFFAYNASDSVSGVDYFRVSTNTSSWINTTQMSYTFDGIDGDYWLYAYAVDNAGNEGTYKMINVSVDTVKPGITIWAPSNHSSQGGPGANWISFSYNTTDSDLDHYEAKIDASNWINTGTTQGTNFDAPDGPHWLYARSVDKHGNVGDFKMINHTTDGIGPNVKFSSPTNGSSYTTDDILIKFYSNDSSVAAFEYSIDNTNWYDTKVCSGAGCWGNGTIYSYTVKDVPEGMTKIQIRGNDSSANIGEGDERWVDVDSIYAGLQISVSAPSSIITATPFAATVWVTNNNEENVTSGQVAVNLTLPVGCSSTTSGWRGVGLIEAGTSDWTQWSVTCQTGVHTLVGWMNYTVQNKQKSGNTTITTVTSFSMDPPEEEDFLSGLHEIILPTPEKAYEPPKVEINDESNLIRF